MLRQTILKCLTESSPGQLARPVQLDKLTRYPPITGGVRNGSPTGGEQKFPKVFERHISAHLGTNPVVHGIQGNTQYISLPVMC